MDGHCIPEKLLLYTCHLKYTLDDINLYFRQKQTIVTWHCDECLHFILLGYI